MDTFVNHILEEWNLVNLQKVFKDHAIDKEAFDELNIEAVKEIIEQWGWRNKFWKKYHQYKKSINNPDTLCFENGLEKSLSSLSLLNTTSTCAPANSLTVSPQRPLRLLTLENLLNSSLKGQVILKTYEKKNTVDRLSLIDIIIWHELNNDPHYKIRTQKFIALTNEIVKLFPNELKEEYYNPRIKTQLGFIRASGALYEKYNNCRRHLTELNMISNSVLQKFSNIAEDDITWLRNNLEPFEEITERWKNSFRFRTELKIGTIHEYFNEFRFLRSSNGYKLLELDFNCKYPNKENHLSIKWPEISKKIIKLAEEKKNKVHEIKKYFEKYDDLIDSGIKQYILTQDKVDLFAFILLPLLMNRRTVKSKTVNKHLFINKEVTQNSFLLHVETEAELQEFQLKKATDYAELQLTIQPYVVICGPISEIFYSAIFVDSVKYCFDNPIDAIDKCMKVFYSLNAEFPIECEHVWTFIAKFIYELPVNKNFSAIYNLIKEIRE